jgi:hypothetical protein
MRIAVEQINPSGLASLAFALPLVGITIQQALNMRPKQLQNLKKSERTELFKNIFSETDPNLVTLRQKIVTAEKNLSLKNPNYKSDLGPQTIKLNHTKIDKKRSERKPKKRRDYR